ncbi:hypothetical protein C4D60_Mb01t08870 [Musa balbisiana]|uniref:acid phosphatase n=1 Tax=Musa balbisiana TaxID=52838 RepID=A0A4S8JNA8_MUSBA|nr:hypothetical protein C4D60_Mb01t08870 [Musa balbisiana]
MVDIQMLLKDKPLQATAVSATYRRAPSSCVRDKSPIPNRSPIAKEKLHYALPSRSDLLHPKFTILPPRPIPLSSLQQTPFSTAKPPFFCKSLPPPISVVSPSRTPSTCPVILRGRVHGRDGALFRPLRNICRSPAAEAVFTDLVRKRGAESKFKIDSAGTIGYHEGDPADSRMRSAAKRRGIEVTSISRPLRPSDFREFDLILAMDMQNREDIMSAYERWRFKEPLPEDAPKKIKLMCSYCKKHNEAEVPDPYYGGPQGFEKVLDLLEDACGSLLDSIMAENSQTSNQ